MSDPAMDGPATDDLEGTDRDVADETEGQDDNADAGARKKPDHPSEAESSGNTRL